MGEWKEFHSEKLHNLYLSLDISRVVKSLLIRWAGHVACMTEIKKMRTELFSYKAVEKCRQEDLDIDGKIKLNGSSG